MIEVAASTIPDRTPPRFLREKIEAACKELLGSSSELQLQMFVSALETILVEAKLEALAEFAAAAGHEINNPIATILGRVQLLLADEVDANQSQMLQIIGGQALRVRDMIADVMLFARPPHPRPEFHNLANLVNQAIKSQSDLILSRRAAITCFVPETLTVFADQTHLLVLISSLIRNSLETTDSLNLKIQVCASSELKQDQQWTLLSVLDNGPGIPPAVREHLFDPFYSGKQAGRGLGFGLSKCWRIAQMHGGMIEVSSSGETTRFDVWLPNPPSAV